jgi:membrane-associated phospholipid phosphatase
VSARTAYALLGAFACALAAAIIWALAFRTGIGHAADARVLDGLAFLQQTRAEPLARLVGRLGNPLPYALLATAVAGAALVTRGVGAALVVAAVIVIPNVVTQILKRELAEDRSGAVAGTTVTVDPASWPSGHSTAMMALALAAVIVTPVAWRGVVAVVGILLALAMAGSVIMLGWHFPSDTVGGFAVAGTAACLGAAALSRRAATTALEGRWHPARG